MRRRPEDKVKSPRGTGGGDPPRRRWEWNQGPRQEQSELLTAGPSLQPPLTDIYPLQRKNCSGTRENGNPINYFYLHNQNLLPEDPKVLQSPGSQHNASKLLLITVGPQLRHRAWGTHTGVTHTQVMGHTHWGETHTHGAHAEFRIPCTGSEGGVGAHTLGSESHSLG